MTEINPQTEDGHQKLARKILKEAMKNSQDPSIKNMASTAIDFVEKYVKKQPTPVQGKASLAVRERFSPEQPKTVCVSPWDQRAPGQAQS